MDINTFTQQFSEQFDETDPSTINSETKYREMGEWSSLYALSVIAMIDQEYNVKLNGNDLRSCNSINELFDLVRGRKGA